VSNPFMKKQNTLHMNDFKAFKFMKDISSRYIFGKVLGQGAYGVVKVCSHKDCGTEFAVKIITK
jgi:serine/threonine protein kinase